MKTRVAGPAGRTSYLTIKVYAVRPTGTRVDLSPATPPVGACGIEGCSCPEPP